MKRALSFLVCFLLLLSLLVSCASSETIVETVTIDGLTNDTGWAESRWINVDNNNGYWQWKPYSSEAISFKYQLRCDDKNLLAAVVINVDAVEGGNGEGTNVRFWINTDPTYNCYTHFYDIFVSGGKVATAAKYNTSSTDNAGAALENSKISAAYTTSGGKTTFEFSVPLSEFNGANGFTYYIAASNKLQDHDNVCLYHPVPYYNGTDERIDVLPYRNWDYDFDGVFDPTENVLSSYEYDPPVPPTPAEIGVTYSGGCYGNGDYIYNVPFNTASEAFLVNEPQLVNVEAKKNIVSTGDKVTDKDGIIYQAVIYGDVNCDGRITSADYLLMKRNYLGTYKLEGAALEAAKVGDKMKSSDYLLVKRAVLGTFDLASYRVKRLKADNEGVKVAYIPLDNRPVNKDRVEFLADAVGIDLLIPEEDLYRTALDNMTPNKNGSTYGDREALLEWLKDVEDECDYYVISLDQMISGGLVSSRWLDNTDLTLETEIADYIIKLAETKHVVLFDTVMRLASTSGYGGYGLDEYNALREYAGKARKQFSGADLTIENIIANYKIDKNGNEISTSLTEAQLKKYFDSRTRKLRIIDYILKAATDDIEAIYIGVDDSKPQVTIQTNEINYIKSLCGDNMTLFTGADELGLMGIAKVMTMIYGQANCNVTYYGGHENDAADAYDPDSLKAGVEKHLLAAGATVKSTDTEALQVLVLTKSYSNAAADSLMAKAKELVAADKPVCIVDCSGVGKGSYFYQILLAEDSGLELGKLLGYSNWNTVANSLGIATGNAISRYLYLYHGAGATAASNDAFLKVSSFSFVKDISYRVYGIGDLHRTQYYYDPAVIVGLLNKSDIMTGIGTYSSHKTISLSNFRQPWNRGFEAIWNINLK